MTTSSRGKALSSSSCELGGNTDFLGRYRPTVGRALRVAITQSQINLLSQEKTLKMFKDVLPKLL